MYWCVVGGEYELDMYSMLMGGHIVVCAGNVHMSGVKNVTLVCWVSYI